MSASSEAGKQARSECGNCGSPVDPVSGRSLYPFDVDVPMAELREELDRAEAEAASLRSQLERAEAKHKTEWEVGQAIGRELDQARSRVRQLEAALRSLVEVVAEFRTTLAEAGPDSSWDAARAGYYVVTQVANEARRLLNPVQEGEERS